MKDMIKTFALAAIAALALTGCIKHEPYGHRPYPDDGGGNNGHGGGGNTEEKLVVRERTDWSIKYIGREDYVSDDGVEQVERFRFVYNGNGYYIIRIVRPEDFRNAYKSDAAAFFTYEAESLLADAKNDGVNFWQYTQEVFNAKTPDVLFNRLRSGTWTAFLIELDTQGNLTGDYAESTFTIQEEVATASFSKWLGAWRVSNGLMGYDLEISSIDNNFIYRIDGWERGPAVSFQMDQEYIEGEFWAQNGYLYIVSQYLGTYDDDNLGTVDELFMGNIFDSNGVTLITDEGIDLAVMVPKEGETAELQPLEVTLKTGSGDYTTLFHSMQYYMWAHDTGEWYPYNTNVAELPLTMTRLPGTRAEVLAPAKERVATKASIHHGQLKAASSARKSVAKKAVRMK
ncbi:MAG: hypothetical protein J6P62_07795 [Bacteroidales bacterium]|nr:hypothetical protein [Bacteroidales bacterium]